MDPDAPQIGNRIALSGKFYETRVAVHGFQERELQGVHKTDRTLCSELNKTDESYGCEICNSRSNCTSAYADQIVQAVETVADSWVIIAAPELSDKEFYKL